MKYKIDEIVDVDKISNLLKNYTQATGLVSALLDLEGNILSKSGWQEICTEFHRKNPESAVNCKLSDTVLSSKLGLGGKFIVYKCLNGLIDVAVPVVVDNEHIGNLFTGQFLFELPDEEFFMEQSNRFNFDKTKYMHALKKVPVIKEEDIKDRLNFLLQMTEIIAELGLASVKQIELNEALAESEKKYRNLFENLNEGFALHEIILDDKGKPVDYRFLEINSSFESLTGLKAENVINRTAREIFVGIENDPVQWIEKYGKVALSGEDISFEAYFKDLQKWFLVHAFCPEKEKFAVSFTDISLQKQAHEALLNSEKKFRTLFEQAAVGVAVADSNTGNYISLNQKHCEIVGFREDELLEMNFQQITHPDDLEEDLAFMEQLKNGQIESYNLEKRYIQKDGSFVWVALNVSPLWRKGEKANYHIAVIADITERKKNEAELLKYRENLEELVKIRTAELEEKNMELLKNNNKLEKFNELFVDREYRIKELREKIKELERR